MSVFTNGCFDLLHVGHVRLLKYAAHYTRRYGGHLTIAVNTDESVIRLKGQTRPIIPLQQRIEMIEAVSLGARIIPFSDIRELLIELYTKGEGPDVIIKSIEYEAVMHTKPEYNLVLDNGGKFVYYDSKADVHTSGIIEKIATRGEY